MEVKWINFIILTINLLFQDGYADGLSEGRDSVFQQGFDAGYEDGFKFSFLLGQYKALKGSNTDGYCPNGLDKTSRGECQICLNPDKIKEDFDELRKLQQMKNKEREDELLKQFGVITYEIQEPPGKSEQEHSKT